MLFNKSTHKKSKLSKIFTGRGATEEDARAYAEVRYNTWSLEQKRAGFMVEELEKQYKLSRRNEVNCKCDLIVNYRLTESK